MCVCVLHTNAQYDTCLWLYNESCCSIWYANGAHHLPIWTGFPFKNPHNLLSGLVLECCAVPMMQCVALWASGAQEIVFIGVLYLIIMSICTVSVLNEQ